MQNTFASYYMIRGTSVNNPSIKSFKNETRSRVTDFAKVAVDEDGVIYVTWNCWDIWYFMNSSSDISTLLEPRGTCPSDAYAT